MSDTWIAAIFGIGGVLLGSGIAFFGQWFTVRAENDRWKTQKKFEVLAQKKLDLVNVLAEINQFIYSDRNANFELMGTLLASDQDLLKMILDFQNAFRIHVESAQREKLENETIDTNATADKLMPQITNLLVEVGSKIYSIENQIDELINQN